MPQIYEGFNQDRAQDVYKSAKDSFLDLSKRAPDAPINDKNALGQWFQQYIQGGMNDRGHRVSEVQGDKFHYANPEGDFWVDYGRGAGAPGGALVWQAEPGDDATRQRYGAGAPVNHAMNRVSAMPGQSDLMAQILESLQEQQVDPQALLLEQLR